VVILELIHAKNREHIISYEPCQYFISHPRPPNVGHLSSIDLQFFLHQIGGNEKGYQDPKFQNPGPSIYNVINFFLSDIKFKMSYLQIHVIRSQEPESGTHLYHSSVNKLQASSIRFSIHAANVELLIFKNRCQKIS